MLEINGRSRLLAVIGDPIAHSLSPLIHNTLACRLHTNTVYMAFRVKPDTLGAFVSAARTLPMAGFNVTMPLKLHIAPYLDRLDETAARGGAVNTVYAREGCLIGGCTDGDGFIESLLLASPSAPMPKRVLILGAGGAARMVALSLAERGALVTAASRRAAAFDTNGLSVNFCRWEDMYGLLPDCDLLINATPLGMSGAAEFSDFTFLAKLPQSAMVYDLVYHPRKTRLLCEAEAIGLRSVSGLLHLICQATLSFEMFTGCRPSKEDVSEIQKIISYTKERKEMHFSFR